MKAEGRTCRDRGYSWCKCPETSSSCCGWSQERWRACEPQTTSLGAPVLVGVDGLSNQGLAQDPTPRAGPPPALDTPNGLSLPYFPHQAFFFPPAAKDTELPCGCRWPNDLLQEGRERARRSEPTINSCKSSQSAKAGGRGG